MSIGVAIFLIIMGVGIAGIWTKDIISSPDIDMARGVFRVRDIDSGSLLWPHWAAEYSTAAACVVGGVGLVLDARWATCVAALATGALLYTSVNSLGWAFAQRDRLGYAYPMLLGAIGGIISAIWLVCSAV